MLNTNQTTNPAAATLTSADYRKAHARLEVQRQIVMKLDPGSALFDQAMSTYEELNLMVDAADRATRADVELLFLGINCEQCGRPHRDEACGHHRADFFRSDLS